jgi:hypothetical protein
MPLKKGKSNKVKVGKPQKQSDKAGKSKKNKRSY